MRKGACSTICRSFAKSATRIDPTPSVSERKIRPTTDAPENRFVKAFIGQARTVLGCPPVQSGRLTSGPYSLPGIAPVRWPTRYRMVVLVTQADPNHEDGGESVWDRTGSKAHPA